MSEKSIFGPHGTIRDREIEAVRRFAGKGGIEEQPDDPAEIMEDTELHGSDLRVVIYPLKEEQK